MGDCGEYNLIEERADIDLFGNPVFLAPISLDGILGYNSLAITGGRGSLVGVNYEGIKPRHRDIATVVGNYMNRNPPGQGHLFDLKAAVQIQTNLRDLYN